MEWGMNVDALPPAFGSNRINKAPPPPPPVFSAPHFPLRVFFVRVPILSFSHILSFLFHSNSLLLHGFLCAIVPSIPCAFSSRSTISPSVPMGVSLPPSGILHLA